jgi:DHA3 family macrolide efflux protein-like MFS transporter
MFSLLKKRGITFLSFSNTISQLGDRLTHMVIITLIAIISPGRISAFSEFSVAFTLPIIVLAPFAGVIIDHYNKQTIMLRCHLVQALLIFLTPTLVMLTHSILPIWILVVLFFSLDLFNNTSRNALVPDLVEHNELVQANSLIITLARIATFIGMVGGGYLVRMVGWQLGFYIDASTHFIAGILVLGMGARILFEPVKKFEFSLSRELKKSFNRFLLDLKELGILLIKDRIVVFVMLSVFILPFVAAVSYTVLIYLVQQEFGMGTMGVGWLGGIIGLGMLVGGLLMGFLGKSVNRGKMIICGMAVLAVFFLIGSVFVNVIFLYIVSVIAGIVFSIIGISQDTILQEDVLKEIRGRIFATKEFVINVTFVLCAIFIGIISKNMKPYAIILGIGVFLCMVTVLAVLIYHSIPAETRTKL